MNCVPDIGLSIDPEDGRATDDDVPPIDEVRELLHRALFAIVVGNVHASRLFAEDVHGDSPTMRVRSRTELEYQLEDRAGWLSNVEFTLDRVERNGAGWFATWRVSGDHTGEALFNEDRYFAPTGRRITMSATTHLDVHARRIRAFRTSHDRDLADQIRRQPRPTG
jgi:hypothetical protein